MSLSMMTLSLLINDTCVTNLLNDGVLGVVEPAERKSCEEMDTAAKKLFLETVTVNEDGRYEVSLPWLDGHSPLPTNYNTAVKRLQSTFKKLKTCVKTYVLRKVQILSNQYRLLC